MKTSSAVKAALISLLGGIIVMGCTVKDTPDTTVVNPNPTVIDKTTPSSTTVVTPPASAPSTSHTDVHVNTPPASAPASTTTTSTGG